MAGRTRVIHLTSVRFETQGGRGLTGTRRGSKAAAGGWIGSTTTWNSIPPRPASGPVSDPRFRPPRSWASNVGAGSPAHDERVVSPSAKLEATVAHSPIRSPNGPSSATAGQVRVVSPPRRRCAELNRQGLRRCLAPQEGSRRASYLRRRPDLDASYISTNSAMGDLATTSPTNSSGRSSSSLNRTHDLPILSFLPVAR